MAKFMTKKLVRPFYRPLTLMINQALLAFYFARLMRWQKLPNWAIKSPTLFKIAAGATGIGCFGYPTHPVFEITSRCNLRCLHCHASGDGVGKNDLSTEDAKKAIRNVATVDEFRMLVFTGGEPLVRKDIYELIEYAHEIGFEVVIATNGVLITPDVAKKMRKAGASGVACSLDSVDPKKHDEFRQMEGAYEGVIRGLQNARDAGLYTQINITVRRQTISEIKALLRKSHELHAEVVLLYQFVPCGRGEGIRKDALTAEEFMDVIQRTKRVQSDIYPIVTPVALPAYWAEAVRSRGHNPEKAAKYIKGCIAGNGMFYIKPNGDVWPCAFTPISGGNLLRDDARDIWYRSPVFSSLKNRDKITGICGKCEYKNVCGGCRARAFSYSGDYLGEDPECALFKQNRRP